MARNQEKAQSMLSRFREAQALELGLKTGNQRRPHRASDCNNRHDAERWRQQVIREISKKISQIQNPALGDYQVRDINDEINKLLREKGHWEVRIRELGGPDYFRSGPKMLDHEGQEVPGNRGYKYFGRAKDLPGVRELFEQTSEVETKRSRAELHRSVDADYYGYRDDEDGVLAPLELAVEQKARAEAIEASHSRKRKLDSADNEIAPKLLNAPVITERDAPSQKEVEAHLVERKKQELLQKYA